MILSVDKKATRVAVLGELGRYPLLLSAIIHTIKYEWHLKHIAPKTSIIGHTYTEMTTSTYDNWFTRIQQIKNTLGISLSSFAKPTGVSKIVNKTVKSKFERFWLDMVQFVNIDSLGRDRNKLRFYRKFKWFYKSGLKSLLQ